MGNYKETLRGQQARNAYAATLGASPPLEAARVGRAVNYVNQSNQLKKGFARNVAVALKDTPTVKLGEIITPPTIHKRSMLVRLEKGGSRVFSITEVVVYEVPKGVK